MEKKFGVPVKIGIYEFLFESEPKNFFWIQGRQMIRHGPIRIPLPTPSQKRCTLTYFLVRNLTVILSPTTNIVFF